MDLLQRLRQKTTMPVIFLTSKDDEIDEVLGLRMGADDYVKKPFSQRLLVERIRALLRRQDAIATGDAPVTEENKIMERGSLRMDPLRHSVTWKGREVSLTVTEFLLLQALAQRPGFVKSRDQLMDVAYDDQVYVDDRTIDSHIKRLRKKMRTVDDDFSAIETLYGDRLPLQRRMTAAPRIAMDDPRPRKTGEVLLGEDWVSPDVAADEMREARPRGGLVSLNRSPLARKIIIFNLMALVILVAGVLFLNPFRDSLVLQRETGLVREAELIADVFEVSQPRRNRVSTMPRSCRSSNSAPGSRLSSSTRPAALSPGAPGPKRPPRPRSRATARPSSPISSTRSGRGCPPSHLGPPRRGARRRRGARARGLSHRPRRRKPPPIPAGPGRGHPLLRRHAHLGRRRSGGRRRPDQRRRGAGRTCPLRA